ncbi:hypothetical protein DC083_07150 [Ignatzschineria ureiclastica]|uniref:Methyltransferase type 11 domain-containing protein n=1 Tax=Ignatzschineria ureiclastica TaxID=472582 RepID=A0A2U2ADY8_9GAMM|nr:methyltransferase domain-containing protein [Ignatzschineria ureiclastica]PWD80876.1 hypothetical protein DC083_07150 [Ignatzschineria ureiclastica]GGZ94190.1 malonyl-[acyl-carrier protein] O-methyltransferase [Ignatzschineria ureiclastica]
MKINAIESLVSETLISESFPSESPISKLSNLEMLNKENVAAQFGKKASQYGQYAVIQRRIADQLITQFCSVLAQIKQMNSLMQAENSSLSKNLNEVFNDPIRLSILDAGAGTGYIGERLAEYGTTFSTDLDLTALDISAEMLQVAQDRDLYHSYVQADIESLPLENRQYDFVISSLAVQWCRDLKRALIELQRVAKVAPWGAPSIFITTLAAGTLQELREAFKQIDNAEHILPFVSEAMIQGEVSALKGEVSVVDEIIEFPTLKDLLASIRYIGANSLPNQARPWLGKSAYQQLEAYFQRLGAYRLTYRVAYITLPGKV